MNLYVKSNRSLIHWCFNLCNKTTLFCSCQVWSTILSSDSGHYTPTQYHCLLCEKGKMFRDCRKIDLLHMVLKFATLFYTASWNENLDVLCLLKVDLLKNCRPESRPYKTSKSTSLFMKVLLLSYMFAVIPVGYVIGKYVLKNSLSLLLVAFISLWRRILLCMDLFRLNPVGSSVFLGIRSHEFVEK